jgi:hypothetical protein
VLDVMVHEGHPDGDEAHLARCRDLLDELMRLEINQLLDGLRTKG